jgi:hypothetical protein
VWVEEEVARRLCAQLLVPLLPVPRLMLHLLTIVFALTQFTDEDAFLMPALDKVLSKRVVVVTCLMAAKVRDV